MSKIVARTLDVLELFAQHKRPLSLSDIARLLEIPVSSCHDVLHALQARGYIYELEPRVGYYPTLRLQIVGKEIGDSDPVILRAETLLRSARDKIGETILLSKANGLRAIYLLIFESTHPLRFLAKVGDEVRTIYCTSGGKALLGNLDDTALNSYLKSARLEPMTNRTITSKAILRKNIEAGRKQKWHLNQGESLEGVTTLSASFRWNASLYIVTIAGPSSRLDRRLKKASEQLLAVCRELEMRV
jgi:DNA-binding IclR family transcriptional regulator